MLTRRRALGLLAGAVVTAGCSSSRHPQSRNLPRPSPSFARRGRAPTAADWRALMRRVRGDVLRPSNSRYDAARLLFDRRFDDVHPQAVVRVASDGDVADVLDFARQHDIAVRVRSGGHSYVGASTGPGIVVDLRGLTDVTVGDGVATLGGGIALIDAYAGLAAHGVSIPAGSCPTVGLSGLALGGGIGVVARRYGLTCDRLRAATVLMADGSTTHCSAARQPDLFWALRGGGAGLGVVTSLTLATHPADPLAHAYVSWPWSAAARVVAAWQSWLADIPRALWSTCHVVATDNSAGPPTVAVAAVLVGQGAQLSQWIGRLTQAVPTRPSSQSVSESSYQSTMLLEAGCPSTSVPACHVRDETPGGTLPRDAFVAASDYFRQPIPKADIARLVRAVEQRQADPRLGAGGASFDSLGGAIDDVAADATAYVHRGARFNAQYTASWQHTPGNGPLARNQRSLASIKAALRSAATGEAYQNYADAMLPDPGRAYFGANLPRLLEIRRRYDPDGLFSEEVS